MQNGLMQNRTSSNEMPAAGAESSSQLSDSQDLRVGNVEMAGTGLSGGSYVPGGSISQKENGALPKSAVKGLALTPAAADRMATEATSPAISRPVIDRHNSSSLVVTGLGASGGNTASNSNCNSSRVEVAVDPTSGRGTDGMGSGAVTSEDKKPRVSFASTQEQRTFPVADEAECESGTDLSPLPPFVSFSSTDVLEPVLAEVDVALTSDQRLKRFLAMIANLPPRAHNRHHGSENLHEAEVRGQGLLAAPHSDASVARRLPPSSLDIPFIELDSMEQGILADEFLDGSEGLQMDANGSFYIDEFGRRRLRWILRGQGFTTMFPTQVVHIRKYRVVDRK
jgi:hypothetical protein